MITETANPNLSRRRPSRSRGLHRSDEEIFEMLERQIRSASSKRFDDPSAETIEHLRAIDGLVQEMWGTLVQRWRDSGWTNREIGDRLGVTGQAVGQRWPRSSE